VGDRQNSLIHRQQMTNPSICETRYLVS